MKRPSPQNSRQGVALVIVLAFLVLLSTLIIAFFSSVQTEAQSSSSYGASVAAKQLVDSALNVAMGQINDATKSTKSASSTAVADRLTWASQPGMIRTWGADGQGAKIHKLFTARNMVTDTSSSGYSTQDELANEVPAEWPNQPALITDLNSPAVVRDDAAGQIVRDGVKYRAEYPIIDPLALGVKSNLTDRVEGFSLGLAPGYTGPTSTDPVSNSAQPAVSETTDPGRSPEANPVPMPVVWFYVLKNGTLTVPANSVKGAGRIANWSGVPADYAPSATNPIVGRFAFWTDDESCKLNINTASEPTPWDTPRAASKKDIFNGQYQPVNKEYQRYPGHPAMTALSPVLIPGKALTSNDKEEIYKLIPRIRTGGSKSGTVPLANPPVAMPVDGDRLLANVDEFLFNPARAALTATNVIDPERLKRARFFLTANSRAPEVNLLGKPRISLWPVHKTARSAYDKVAAFCTTLGPSAAANTNQYYFQRTDSKSATADYKDIARNQQLYKYLQSVTTDAVPGFGGNLKTSWGEDHDQVLTEIFDYIRCVNLADNQAGATAFASDGQVVPIEINATNGATRGFGRIDTISQFGIQFICNQDDVKRTAPATTALPAGNRKIQAAILFSPFSPSMGWYALTENIYVVVTINKPVTVDDKILFAKGIKNVAVQDTLSGYHLDGRKRGGVLGFRGLIRKAGGAYPLISQTITLTGIDPKTPTMNFDGADLTVNVYANGANGPLLQTFNVVLPSAKIPAPDLVLTGTSGYGSGVTTTANDWWNFSTRFAANKLEAHPLAPGPEYKDPNRRWADWGNPPGFKAGCMFRAEDVVRSVVPEHGDLRLIAAKKTIGNAFVPIGPSYHDSKINFSHIFAEPAGNHLLYGFGNEPSGTGTAAGPRVNTQLAAPIPGSQNQNSGTVSIAQPGDQLTDANYHWSHLPEIRPGAGKQYNKFGDFDNGIAQSTDGSYINKPDEGNQKAEGTHWPYFHWNYDPLNSGYFSPNRLVPSAGMLGSLPTGVMRHSATDPRAWQTLLFRPQKGHPGDPGYSDAGTAKNPTNKAPDHLVMDLFWMPVVEPYAISEPFSTAGKINMNYEIAPFSYIRRATALHGVMKSEEPLAVPKDAENIYKIADHETASNLFPDEDARGCVDPSVKAKWLKYVRTDNAPMRQPIDIPKTLAQFDTRFKAGEIFRSASQICEVHLVNKGWSLSDYEQTVTVNGVEIPKFWNQHVVTGDNSRERPYTNLYSRLTTKSNVFTVHIRAQVLRKSGTATANQWDEDKDKVVSEYRGSSIIERYIDASDPNLPDFANAANSGLNVDSNYRFRVVSTKRFAP